MLIVYKVAQAAMEFLFMIINYQNIWPIMHTDQRREIEPNVNKQECLWDKFFLWGIYGQEFNRQQNRLIIK